MYKIAVDSAYIVATDIFQDRNDVWTLIPFLKATEKNLSLRYPSVTSDFGYESKEAHTYLRSVNQKPYIKPQTYEKWKKRSFKQDISKRENMGYDQTTDTYTCHAGKTLIPLFIRKQKSKSGYVAEVTVYECEDFTGCPYKEKCSRAKGNKRLYISKSFLEKRQESYENSLSETGIKYRMNRSIQVKAAFRVLKNDYEFQRFLLLGKNKVKLEILLPCMAITLINCMQNSKIRKGSQNKRNPSGFFYAWSEGIAHSSNLIILQHPLLFQKVCSILGIFYFHQRNDMKHCKVNTYECDSAAEYKQSHRIFLYICIEHDKHCQKQIKDDQRDDLPFSFILHNVLQCRDTPLKINIRNRL